MGSRWHKLHLVGQIHTFDVMEMSNNGLRGERCVLVQNGINGYDVARSTRILSYYSPHFSNFIYKSNKYVFHPK